MASKSMLSMGQIDLSTGNVAWSFAGDGELSSPPIVIDRLVAIGSQSGNVYLLKAATGRKVWSANANAAITNCYGCIFSGLAAAQGRLIVPASNLLVAYAPPN